MRHRQRIRKDNNLLLSILQTFNHHLLHSDKSTYFYNNKHSDDNNKKQRYKLSYSHSWQTIPLVCSSFALLGIGIGLVNPIGSSNGEVYATTVTEDITPYASIAFSLSNSDGTELNNDDTVSLESVPGIVSYITTNINLTTTHINRFYVGVQAVGSDGNLTGTVNKATIAPVTANTKPASFGDNTWGYNLGDNTSTANSELSYSPLPAYSTSTPLQYTSASNLTDGDYSLKLTFAAKITANQPADHYTTKAMVSVVADAKEAIGFLNASKQPITTMQEMTSSVCNGATIGYTTQLKDIRDQKYYWVARLKDGNCWMTQNLDFDVSATLNTDGITSDVPTANFPTDTIKIEVPSEWTGTNAIYNAYYDPGDYIYIGSGNDHGPAKTSCGVTDDKTLSSCDQFANVPTSTTVSSDINTHYHIGNYYSWSATTVKSGDGLSAKGDPAPNSICPKNWQLPTSGTDTSNTLITEKGTFAKLFEAYGWSWGKDQNGNPYSDSNNGGSSYNIYSAPFYFVYGGYFRDGAARYIGDEGLYASSTINAIPVAFQLSFTNNGVRPANSYYRHYYGYSVRCIAR